MTAHFKILQFSLSSINERSSERLKVAETTDNVTLERKINEELVLCIQKLQVLLK